MIFVDDSFLSLLRWCNWSSINFSRFKNIVWKSVGEGKCLDWKEDAKIIFKLSEIRHNVGGIGKKSFINSSNTGFPFSSVHFSKLFFFSKKTFQKDVNNFFENWTPGGKILNKNSTIGEIKIPPYRDTINRTIKFILAWLKFNSHGRFCTRDRLIWLTNSRLM